MKLYVPSVYSYFTKDEFSIGRTENVYWSSTAALLARTSWGWNSQSPITWANYTYWHILEVTCSIEKGEIQEEKAKKNIALQKTETGIQVGHQSNGMTSGCFYA